MRAREHSVHRACYTRTHTGTAFVAHLPRRLPEVDLAIVLRIDVDEDAAQLDACAERRPQLQHSISCSQPAEHHNLKSDLQSTVADADAQKDRMRLCSNAMNDRVEGGVHPVSIIRSCEEFGLNGLRQRQRAADCTKACRNNLQIGTERTDEKWGGGEMYAVGSATQGSITDSQEWQKRERVGRVASERARWE